MFKTISGWADTFVGLVAPKAQASAACTPSTYPLCAGKCAGGPKIQRYSCTLTSACTEHCAKAGCCS